jgi:hypothetical protein
VEAAERYPNRACHWVRHNKTERIPHRWVVADSEARVTATEWGESQSLRCAVATRWRDDLATGDHQEWMRTSDASVFWEWVTDWCSPRGRTVVWFQNAGYDLRILDAFARLPALGWELDWCNLDRDVSVACFKGPRGTLTIADTFTWIAKGLDAMAAATGIRKPPLPRDSDPEAVWVARCEADVKITEAIVRDLLGFIASEHLGNWQPSGAGMGYTAWRHRFMQHKVLVHDDAQALAAEREAMHAGRAEAWWHGKASNGPFAEWDMSMAYTRIAAECDIPVKLWAYDPKPTRAVHEWARKHWGILARVQVDTPAPVVPARLDGRVTWPVGRFETTLWDCELDLITAAGGHYKVLEQWRYNMRPALKEWADWSIMMCGAGARTISPVAATWVKHQARATIGRFSLRTASWVEYGGNPQGMCGLSTLVDAETGEAARMMHVGSRTMLETERTESGNSLPQVTGYIMAQSRCRLWAAAQAAGLGHVLHVDTDSIITDRTGSRAIAAAARAGLPGGWRRKHTWPRLDITGPRHYRTPDRRQVPGVPSAAVEVEPGVYVGEIWESLAASLTRGHANRVEIRGRTWRPNVVDHRRPYQGEQDAPAVPITAGHQ